MKNSTAIIGGLSLLGLAGASSLYQALSYKDKLMESADASMELIDVNRELREQNQTWCDTAEGFRDVNRELREQNQTWRDTAEGFRDANRELIDLNRRLTDVVEAQRSLFQNAEYFRVLGDPFDLHIHPACDIGDLREIISNGYLFSNVEANVLLTMSGSSANLRVKFSNGLFISDDLFLTVAHGSLEYSGDLGLCKIDTGEEAVGAYLVAYSAKLDLGLFRTATPRSSSISLYLSETDECERPGLQILERIPTADSLYDAMVNGQRLELTQTAVGDLHGELCSRTELTTSGNIFVRRSHEMLRLDYVCDLGNSGSPVYTPDLKLLGIVHSVDEGHTYAVTASSIRSFIDAVAR